MTLALLAMFAVFLATPAELVATSADPQTAPRARSAPAVPASGLTAITVTDLAGAPLADVRVTLTGGLDRSGSTQADGTVRFDGLRPGTYRLRFEKPGFVLFEKELDVRAGQPAPNPSVALSPSRLPIAPPTPSAPSEPSAREPKTTPMALPPPGKPVTLEVPDYIERNFISGSQPQKVSNVGCSGLASTVLWQIREPWSDRRHPDADAMLYVIGGDGTLRLDGRDTSLAAGSFASVPRGLSYSLSRRGRNPLIVLATLAGEPCGM